jgi:HK97 family phage major capsid protein
MRRDDILALKEQRAHLLTEMQEIAAKTESENRDFTAEEQQEFERKEDEFRTLTTRWQRAEELYMQEKEVKRSLETPVDLAIDVDGDVPTSLTAYRQKTRPPLVQDTAEYRAAWYHYMSTLKDAELDVVELRVLSKATGAAGANLVPTDFAREIVNIARFMGPVNQLANTMTTDSGETIQIPSVSAHGVASWIAESGAYSPSDETFGQATLGAFKAGTKVIVSEELLVDSAFALDSYLAEEFGERIGLLEETAYVVGDGTGKPMGIANAGSGVAVSQAATGNATAFTYAALVSFVYALPYQYRRNAIWIFSDSAVKNLYLLVDGQQRPIWSTDPSTTGPDTLLGYPVYTSPDLAVSAASAKSGIFGDVRRAYRIRRVNGFSLQRQNELHSDNGQVGFRGYERVDGRVVLADAIRVLQHSAT